MLYRFDDIHSRAAALEARARQMQREELRRLFGLAVSALARGASRLARIGTAAVKGAAAGVHAAVIEKDRERFQYPVRGGARE